MKPNTLSVAEVFYSIQGEGPTTGKPAFFIRLAGCNLMCGGKGTEKDGKLHNGATWRCDTIEVWMKGTKMSFQELFDELDDCEPGVSFLKRIHDGAHIIFTGGEPLLQQKGIVEFVKWLQKNHFVYHATLEIETNGTIMPIAEIMQWVTYWNISPKLNNSGVEFKDRVSNIFSYFTGSERAIFKFVIKGLSDWNEIYLAFIETELIDKTKIWLMPAADNKEDLEQVSKTVAKIALGANLNFSNRLHIQLWNKKTGV